MAITNAQQYQQLVKKPSGSERPGYKGRDTDYQQRGTDRQTYSATQQQQNFSARDRDDSPPRSRIQEDRQKDFEQQQLKKRMQNLTDDQDFEDAVRSGKIDEKLYSYSVPKSNFPGPVGAGLNLFQGARQRNYEANRDFFLNKVLTSANRGNFKPTFDSYSSYMQQRLAGQIDAYGNPLGGQDDEDDQPIIPIIPQDPLTMDQATEELIEEEEPFELARRFRADGGIMNDDIIGGMMDGNMDEMGRQMYGLGKLVKKVTRGVKKIVKSPLGKAAIAGYFLGGGSLGGILKSRPGFSFANLGSSLGLGTLSGGEENIFTGGPFSNVANIVRDKLTSTGGKFMAGATLASVLPFFGLGTGDETEEEAKRILDNSGISPEEFNRLRNDIDYQNQILNRRSRAGGGIMRLGYEEGGDAEPVAKKTMPLIDMGGKEKDYRETGGFVDMGRMERADDVPARLSKNEFVFTADAVRNAGDGDIDKGAEVMYNMMKNLENGGDVSEESQGLEGARKMFQTSQRLEEVL
jgi:hypothetical protein